MRENLRLDARQHDLVRRNARRFRLLDPELPHDREDPVHALLAADLGEATEHVGERAVPEQRRCPSG